MAELLDTPPPGLDEAIAILKVSTFWNFLIIHIYITHIKNDSLQVMEFVDSPDCSMFTRIVFDTASTVSNIIAYVKIQQIVAFYVMIVIQILVSCRVIHLGFCLCQTS